MCIRNGCCGEDVLLQLVETGDKRDQTQMNLKFQVADVAKPLVSVRRIAEKGNIVQFGPGMRIIIFRTRRRRIRSC